MKLPFNNNREIYKEVNVNNIKMIPSDLTRLLDELFSIGNIL